MKTIPQTLQERALAVFAARQAAAQAAAQADDRRIATQRATTLEERIQEVFDLTVTVPPNYSDPTEGPTVTVEGLTFVLDSRWDMRLQPTCPRCGGVNTGWPSISSLEALGAALSKAPALCFTCYEADAEAARAATAPVLPSPYHPTTDERLIQALRAFVVALTPGEDAEDE